MGFLKDISHIFFPSLYFFFKFLFSFGQLSPGKPLDPEEAAENKTIPKKNPEKPNPPGAERAGSFGNIPLSAPLPSGTTPKPPNPPNLGSGAAKTLGKEGRALEWDNDSVTSEWDSSDLTASPGEGHKTSGIS